MKAMILEHILTLEPTSAPLRQVEMPMPKPAPHELLVKVHACGVCHTELDEIEGRTAPSSLPIVLGHEIVGTVVDCGHVVTDVPLGTRVGVGWIHHGSGACDENLNDRFRATGRDRNGGYAEFMTVPERYTYPIPDEFDDAEAAPLLCAGGIGYRALNLTGIADGQWLGLTGFGGSAHLVLQLTRHLLPNTKIAVFARDEASRAFARSLGADWVGAIRDRAPEPLHAVIDTTPVWLPVIEALANLAPGGRLVINAIRKEDSDKEALLGLRYHEHLWLEKEIKSVANITHFDLKAFLPIAAAAGIKPEIEVYPLEEANQALLDLKFKPVQGAKVLHIAG